MDNRRLHQCHHDGCDRQAEWQLMLSCHCYSGFHLKIPSTLMVCDKHTKAAMEIATNDHARQGIRNACWQQGWGMPDFSSLTAMFAPVDHAAVEGNA